MEHLIESNYIIVACCVHSIDKSSIITEKSRNDTL